MVRLAWRLPSTPTPLQNTSESPTSPTSPLSPPIPNRTHSSPTRSTSSTSTNGPLTPPLRLHLRSIIPSPPLPAEYLATAPALPYPWIWRCHLCHSVYRLGVTRRCLEDGHFFCSLPSPPRSPITPAPSTVALIAEDTIIAAAKRARQKRKRDKKRAAMRGCRAEFDYGGWSTYNIWRRGVRNSKVGREKKGMGKGKVGSGIDAGKGKAEKGKKGRVSVWSWDWDAEEGDVSCDFPIGDGAEGGAEGTERDECGKGEEILEGRQLAARDTWCWDSRYGGRDCWHDCNFPSECHNERKAEREWEARMKEMRRWDEEWRELVIGAGGADENLVDSGVVGDGKRRKSSSEDSTASVCGDHGVGIGEVDGDGDTVMSDLDLDTDLDIDVETEADADAWSTYIPSSEATHQGLNNKNIIGLAITTTSEPSIDFTTHRSPTSSPSGLEYDTHNPNLGPLGTDCDGLGEAGYQLSYTQSRRRKSVEGLLGESPPSSPLKEVSFGFEAFEGDVGVGGWRSATGKE
ncbi:hypothetical protein BKA61DRAFT_571612 [Leptodontidium sp. MPI-SDFR-AT-0119]|nr:hypothetical protein BKA61DRAFT_571612 [Leptodontidium sp. MPI-SDFR-AT-0119]